MRVRTPGWMLVGMIAALCSPSGLLPAVSDASAAQEGVKAPDSYIVTVRDGVLLRCRAGSIWYPVTTLKSGQVLRVMGETEGWQAVEYPPGTPAVARIERVELRKNAEGDEVAVLMRPSTLYAYNTTDPTSDMSYNGVFKIEQLPAGTELPILGTIEKRGGVLGGYLVDPPRGAIGYVQPLGSDVRLATDAEIAAFLQESGWDQQLGDGENDASEEHSDDDGGMNGTPEGGDGSGDTDSGTETGTGEGADDADDSSDNDKDNGKADDAEAELDAYDKAERELLSLNDAFQRVLNAPMDEAELTGMREAYDSLLTRVPEGEEGRVFRDVIGVQLELLSIREELQEMLREANALEARINTTPDTMVVDRSQSLGYEAVGRLMPSLIYDGARLPLLYRVVSVDSAYGRTLAYVAPSEDVELTSALGSIVGVHGEATTEQDRRVPILTPERVDVLRSGG